MASIPSKVFVSPASVPSEPLPDRIACAPSAQPPRSRRRTADCQWAGPGRWPDAACPRTRPNVSTKRRGHTAAGALDDGITMGVTSDGGSWSIGQARARMAGLPGQCGDRTRRRHRGKARTPSGCRAVIPWSPGEHRTSTPNDVLTVGARPRPERHLGALRMERPSLAVPARLDQLVDGMIEQRVRAEVECWSATCRRIIERAIWRILVLGCAVGRSCLGCNR